MAKSAILLALAVCLVSLNVAYCHDGLFVEGTVYCDTCRSQFFTKVSNYLAGATIRVDCKREDNGTLTFSKEAVTDAAGNYKLEVDGDHEEEVCEVSLVKSSDPECSDVNPSAFVNQAARISITKNNGIVSSVRTANPIGFLRKVPLADCQAVLGELGLDLNGNPLFQ